jgi:hypothetical protein
MKKHYSTPVVIVHGTVEEITQTLEGGIIFMNPPSRTKSNGDSSS